VEKKLRSDQRHQKAIEDWSGITKMCSDVEVAEKERGKRRYSGKWKDLTTSLSAHAEANKKQKTKNKEEHVR